MFEVILIIGMFLSIWGSAGNGLYQLMKQKAIPEDEKISKGFAIGWIIGGIITFVAVFYIINKSEQKREYQSKYELIQQPVYRKIKYW